MSNSKRQTVVIAVLILLIACAGWFAKRFNDSQDLNALSTSNENTENSNLIVESRMGRDNQRSALKQELEKIVSDVNQTEEAKNQANEQLMMLLDRGNKENKIETLVMDRGYEDALCFIDEYGVEMSVKNPEPLNAEQVNQITDIVVRTTGISPSNIVVKQQK
jgi:stage III sporulation protein AH